MGSAIPKETQCDRGLATPVSTGAGYFGRSLRVFFGIFSDGALVFLSILSFFPTDFRGSPCDPQGPPTKVKIGKLGK